MEPALRARPAPCRCALVAALLAPALARAEDASPDTRYGEEIEVTGHYENAVGSSDAASAGRITNQVVEDRPLLRPGEALGLVAGLGITQHSVAGRANHH